MKTIWNSLCSKSHYYMALVVASALALVGCTETSPDEAIPGSLVEEYSLHQNILTEQYWVDPGGTVIKAFDGAVILEFSDGAFKEPTLINISSFPLHHLDLDGYNLMNRGISITNDLQRPNFNSYAMVSMTYDPMMLRGKKEVNESALTIFKVCNYSCANERLESIGNCTIDADRHTVSGCIYCCGFYVIGEE